MKCAQFFVLELLQFELLIWTITHIPCSFYIDLFYRCPNCVRVCARVVQPLLRPHDPTTAIYRINWGCFCGSGSPLASSQDTKKVLTKKILYRIDTLARIEWNWMNALVGLLLNTHVYHILRTCDVRHLLNGLSLISNRQYSMNNLFHVRCGSTAQIATDQWPAHHSTISTAFILHVQIPHVRATGPKITRTNTRAWGHLSYWYRYGGKYLLQLTINPICAPLQPILCIALSVGKQSPLVRLLEISPIYFYFALSREIHFSIITKII